MIASSLGKNLACVFISLNAKNEFLVYLLCESSELRLYWCLPWCQPPNPSRVAQERQVKPQQPSWRSPCCRVVQHQPALKCASVLVGVRVRQQFSGAVSQAVERALLARRAEPGPPSGRLLHLADGGPPGSGRLAILAPKRRRGRPRPIIRPAASTGCDADGGGR